ncbi:rab11 family-interacting protein 3 isoform X2 [Molothrus aeneus]|uniref:rab11 family-interacting protein 3 isoform X2 n=1 Tax=Molothrus aeneus TaxID=84833 RepID=UPI0034590DB8
MEPRPPGTEPPLPRGPGPGPEPELEPEPEPELEPEPEPELDLEPEPDLDLQREPEPELEPEPEPMLDLEPELELELEPDLDLQREPELEPEPEPELDLYPEPELEPELEQREADLSPEPELELEPDPELEQEAELGPELDLDLWALDAAAAGAGPPPWCPGQAGGSPGPERSAEPPPEEEPRLRPVFDALDRDGDGFVRVEEFVQFATAYGAEQVKDLTKYLDPSGLGVISFEDFHRGIRAIRNGDPDSQLYDMGYTPEEEAPACPDEFDDFVTFEANEVTDSAYMGSESTYSECETFTDEDTSTLVQHEMHDEVETDSAIDSAVHSEFTDPIEEPEHGSHPHELALGSELSHSIVTVIRGEEHFEDYGEGNEADLFPDPLCNGESSFGSSSFLSPSPNKRLSSKKVARQLHQTSSLAVGVMEESYRESLECTDEDITDKVVFLEKRVTELEKDTAANGEQHSRLRQENLQLVHRANALEEQLKEQELRADQTLLEEIKKQRELLSKMEREKSIEIENLQARLQQLDDENSELRSCVPCLRANIERLEEEKQKLLDEIEDLTVQLTEEQEKKRKMGDKLSQERHQFQKEKESTQELIEDLRKQLEHLQLFKLEAEQRRGRSSSLGLQEYNSRTRETELEQEIKQLKQDNRNLKEQNDELNGQIINLSIQGAKNLFSASFSESLAAEISSVSRDELMEAIQKQEEINFRLQDYIDRIIVAIMETNPSILEVK